MLHPTFYKTVLFSAVLYVLNIDDPNTDYSSARKHINQLFSEDELRHVTLLVLVLNFEALKNLDKVKIDRKKKYILL